MGLLTAKAGLSARTSIGGKPDLEEFKGALTEQYVAQELHAAGYPLYYFGNSTINWKDRFYVAGRFRLRSD